MISNKPEGPQIRLGGSIQPADREEALEKLSLSLEMGDHIALDIGGLTEIDTATIQILLSLHKETIRQNKQLQLTSVSAVAQNAFDLLNLPQPFSGTAKPV